jgi:hypothetical protein
MHEYMHDREGLPAALAGAHEYRNPRPDKEKSAEKTPRHKIKTRNTDPSVTFTGIAGHVAGISGHVHRNTHRSLT